MKNKIFNFLKEHKERLKPCEANKLGLKNF